MAYCCDKDDQSFECSCKQEDAYSNLHACPSDPLCTSTSLYLKDRAAAKTSSYANPAKTTYQALCVFNFRPDLIQDFGYIGIKPTEVKMV